MPMGVELRRRAYVTERSNPAIEQRYLKGIGQCARSGNFVKGIEDLYNHFLASKVSFVLGS